MTEVQLSSGQVIEVQAVPPFVFTAIEAAHPLPHGKVPHAEMQAALLAREQLQRETAWLIALPDVEVPEGWAFPRALGHAGIQPRAGEHGRLLDYIEYGLLATPEDVRAVQTAMYGGALTEEEIGAAEATFPGDGGREEPLTYPLGSE